MSEHVDDSELAGLDPADLMDAEAARIDAFYAGASDEVLDRPSRCEGWSVGDVLRHLLGDEEYFQACLDGTVGELFQRAAEAGATDVNSWNNHVVASLRDRPVADVLEEWRRLNADTRRRWRERGDGTVDTSVGEYSARLQGLHVAAEWATHADDVGVPVSDAEAADRLDWRTRMSRFSLVEAKPGVKVSRTDGGTRVEGDGGPVEVGDADLVEAVNGRLTPDAPFTAEQRDLLAITP